jgi:hypothetical protein
LAGRIEKLDFSHCFLDNEQWAVSNPLNKYDKKSMVQNPSHTPRRSRLCPLSDPQKWRFVQLLCLAGECRAEGCLISSGKPLSLEQIVRRLRLEVGVLSSDLQALAQAGLVRRDEATQTWLVPGLRFN